MNQPPSKQITFLSNVNNRKHCSYFTTVDSLYKVSPSNRKNVHYKVMWVIEGVINIESPIKRLS